MSLNEPQRNSGLPQQLQGLLNAMYAGPESGMSGPAIIDFFRRYSNAIESYRWDQNWRPSRWRMFEDCLSQFPSEQQKVIVQDLILHPGPMKYGPPNSLDVQRVQEWLFNEVLDGESIDHVVVTPYGMEIITRSAISVSLAGKTPPSTRARCSESVIGLASKAIELEDIESRLAALERATEASKQTR